MCFHADFDCIQFLECQPGRRRFFTWTLRRRTCVRWCTRGRYLRTEKMHINAHILAYYFAAAKARRKNLQVFERKYMKIIQHFEDTCLLGTSKCARRKSNCILGRYGAYFQLLGEQNFSFTVSTNLPACSTGPNKFQHQKLNCAHQCRLPLVVARMANNCAGHHKLAQIMNDSRNIFLQRTVVIAGLGVGTREIVAIIRTQL